MKKTGLFIFMISCALTVGAQDITLPEPLKTGGKPLMDCLNERKTIREFDAERPFDNQTLANLLWAAWGYNRAEKRTAPSSRNKQEIDIYVAMKSGLYLWDAKENVLKLSVNGDLRAATALQPGVADASAVLIYVSNTDKIEGKNHEELIAATYANAGFIAQNVYLFCASENLGSVIRAMVDRPKLSETMSLTGDQMILLVQSVGFPAN